MKFVAYRKQLRSQPS